ncbi:MAG: aminoacetone oxidase family FAD-binding enzyme [Ruminococcus sp.]|nr:aminoacetone oxidase family FAD-binding enzyme [Ruminococcus sp.]
MMNYYDAIIIGGGAAGLMCAISAKQKNTHKKIVIIEKNDRVGKKLLATGNGRCNLTNQNITTSQYAGSFTNQAEKIFKRYSTEHLLNIFGELGLMTYADNEGRYYPVCRQASAVLDVLRFACERLGVEIICQQDIKTLKKQKDKFEVKTNSTEFYSDKLVIACGSKAAPKLGGNASGFDYLKNFGHKVIPFSPALCPIKVNSNVLKSLKGIRSATLATLADENGKAIMAELGEVQFADNALSGICIFNLSIYAKKGYAIMLDLMPNTSFSELCNILFKQKELFEQQTIDNIFTGIFQKRLAQAVIKTSGINDFSRICRDLSEKEIKSICRNVKSMKFEISDKESFDKAQCALGGAKGNEIDEKTMQSKIVKGLYIVGEAVDICGMCGGYNLHFAFSSGHLAGENL